MKITELNGMIVLTPDLGKLIRNKITGNYSTKVYIGKNVSMDNYEEVDDETISESLKQGIIEIQNREQSLTKIGKIVAKNITDDKVALEIKEFYDYWNEGENYEVGRYLNYKDVLYKVLTSHTSQADWTPDTAPSLFANVLINLDGTPKEWIQPDSTNPYMTGDKVIFEGVIYESIIDNNIWSPSAYPQGWKVVEG